MAKSRKILSPSRLLVVHSFWYDLYHLKGCTEEVSNRFFRFSTSVENCGFFNVPDTQNLPEHDIQLGLLEFCRPHPLAKQAVDQAVTKKKPNWRMVELYCCIQCVLNQHRVVLARQKVNPHR